MNKQSQRMTALYSIPTLSFEQRSCIHFEQQFYESTFLQKVLKPLREGTASFDSFFNLINDPISLVYKRAVCP